MLIKYVVSRWSSGNRRRATSAREVIEVAGSNHAIGVILNLAWGPNNFSPSMIWNWRTRSNSRTGLGAEELLPAKSAFCFFYFFSFLLSFLSSFSFSLFLFQSSFLFRATLLIVSYILNPVVFAVAQKPPAKTLFPWSRNGSHFTHFHTFFFIFLHITRYSFVPRIANANRGGSNLFICCFFFTDLI